MTNKTGPAQQRDQPTQLTATEARELDTLITSFGDAAFRWALASAALGRSRSHEVEKETEAQRRQEYQAAQRALYQWQLSHGFWAVRSAELDEALADTGEATP